MMSGNIRKLGSTSISRIASPKKAATTISPFLRVAGGFANQTIKIDTTNNTTKMIGYVFAIFVAVEEGAGVCFFFLCRAVRFFLTEHTLDTRQPSNSAQTVTHCTLSSTLDQSRTFRRVVAQ